MSDHSRKNSDGNDQEFEDVFKTDESGTDPSDSGLDAVFDTNAESEIPAITDSAVETDAEKLSDELDQTRRQLEEAKADRMRALADYQNLQRRTQEDRTRMAKLANVALVTDLLDHLDHLSMAADQLKDKGLEMTIKQLWQTLNDHGLRELDVVGKPFDPEKMEVVESESNDPKAKVKKIIRRGYELNGVVIRVAKVTL